MMNSDHPKRHSSPSGSPHTGFVEECRRDPCMIQHVEKQNTTWKSGPVSFSTKRSKKPQRRRRMPGRISGIDDWCDTHKATSDSDGLKNEDLPIPSESSVREPLQSCEELHVHQLISQCKYGLGLRFGVSLPRHVRPQLADDVACPGRQQVTWNEMPATYQQQSGAHMNMGGYELIQFNPCQHIHQRLTNPTIPIEYPSNYRVLVQVEFHLAWMM